MDNKELVFKERNICTEKNAEKYAAISMRITRKMLEKSEEVQRKTSLSRNALICRYIQYGLEHT